MTRPDSAIVIRRYSDLHPFVRAFAKGKLNLLILIGPPGCQKSRTVQAALGKKQVCWIEGHATAFGIYLKLFENIDRPVVIDDVDGLYSDKRAVRMLKTLCNTEETKWLGWESDAARLEVDNVPNSFCTRSKLCLIANQWRSLNINVRAIEDRGHVIYFEPTAEEIHKRIAQGNWFKDREVYDWIGRHLHLIEQPSMRQYILASEKKAAGLDWRKLTLNQWSDDEGLILAASILQDRRFKTQEARVKEFVKRGGGVRGTFYRKVKELRHRNGKA